MSPPPSVVPNAPPPSSPAPSPTANVDSGPFAESLSWIGSARGSLTRAYGACDLPYLDMVYLHTAGDAIEVSFPRHSSGEITESIGNPGIALHLNGGVDGYTLFVVSSGTLTYGPIRLNERVARPTEQRVQSPTIPPHHRQMDVPPIRLGLGHVEDDVDRSAWADGHLGAVPPRLVLRGCCDRVDTSGNFEVKLAG